MNELTNRKVYVEAMGPQSKSETIETTAKAYFYRLTLRTA